MHRVPGSGNVPNSDMFFTEQDGDNMEYGLSNTMYTQGPFDDGPNNFIKAQMAGQRNQVHGYVPSSRELQFNENQQKALLSSIGNLPPFDEKTLFNPLRTHFDKVYQLKLRSYIKQGCPIIDEIKELQTHPLHHYRGKHTRD